MSKVGEPRGDAATGYRWTKIFSETMDRLSAPLLQKNGDSLR
jgi:hypothetical protein